VVEAIEASHPDLVCTVREWRRALRKLQDERRWTTEQLHDRLSEVGVKRELQTLDGWLRLDQASPIGPQHIRKEIGAMWPLLAEHTDRSADEVVETCGRLRSLRSSAGRALLKLWKGRTVDLGVDDVWLEELVDELNKLLAGVSDKWRLE
jgi:Arc/MetJ-type ribon-helix-helix transcriptional regulator